MSAAGSDLAAHWKDFFTLHLEPHMPLLSTLMYVDERLATASKAAELYSQGSEQEQQIALPIAVTAIEFAGRVFDHLGLWDGDPPPLPQSLPVALRNLQALRHHAQEYLAIPLSDTDNAPAQDGAVLPSVASASASAEADVVTVADLSPSQQKAFALYEWATCENPSLKTDREVHEYLCSHTDIPGNADVPPSCETFTRYLRHARRHLKQQKNTPRAGRPHGSSIVHASQVEPEYVHDGLENGQ